VSPDPTTAGAEPTSTVLIALDKFKGSIDADPACRAVAQGIADITPRQATHIQPIADGGDGTVEVLLRCGFESAPVTVQGPTGEVRQARLALRGDEAFVELAEVCGMRHLPHGRLEPWHSGSVGLGQAVRLALDLGARTIGIGLGGSASTDGGIGMLQALGAVTTDASGQVCTPDAAGMAAARTLHLTGLDARVADTDWFATVDVDNPLCGPHGAAAMFAPQKGANEDDVARLDAALDRWGRLLTAKTGRDVRAIPGGGAAGGVGAAVAGVLRGDLVSGADHILTLLKLGDAIDRARLVVTGEGSWDAQTGHGKAPQVVLEAARARGVPVVVVAGRISPELNLAAQPGIAAGYQLVSLEPDTTRCMAAAPELLRQVGRCLSRQHLGSAAGDGPPTRL
jgi:glycerate kinase